MGLFLPEPLHELVPECWLAHPARWKESFYAYSSPRLISI